MTYPSNVSGSEEVNHAALKSFVERIENLETEIAERNQDKAAIYGELKFSGFDKKIVRKVVALRRMDRDKRIEEQTILDTYLRALGEPA